ncbi:MAG: YceI family protein [Chloroflexota bacterium]|nr:YceI family protein [Chloroflexota bacterium]
MLTPGRAVALFIVALAVAACGSPAAVTVDPTAGPTTAAPTTTAPVAAGALTWTVSDKSKAVARVREQLVGVNLPSDAVLTATGAKGSFSLNADGSFSPDSKITFELTTLSSDSRDRDNFVKQDTLNTRQFPTATFVPAKTTGLTLPLPASGDLSFTLTGALTIHGKSKDLTFTVKGVRTAADLTVTATADPALKFGDFGMSAPSVPFRVVSVTDEIRLAIDIVATGPKG